ncbi:MAG: hypothetical protein ACYTJ0_03430 [Planctomycetota bacterium]|jgi:hypothetical protein
MKTLMIPLVLLLIAPGQVSTPAGPWRLLEQGKYLAAVRAAEQSTADPAIRGQEIATMRSMVGDDHGALAAMSSALGHQATTVAETSPLDACEALDALATIVEMARDRRVVILNEAHHVPMHRGFALRVARALRPLGFSYLAAETLKPDTAPLAERGFPLRSDGFYAAEPVFGDFLREALRLGYQPVAYEMTARSDATDPLDRVNQREAAQCANLIERIFDRDPEAKVLIFVGYSHATENVRSMPDGREQAWMAARLARATGLDPLTIDQTVQMALVPDDASSSDWRYAERRGWIKRPTVFRRADGSFFVGGHYAGRVDMQVFHPRPKLVRGRPDWLLADGHRTAIAIPAEALPAEGRVLVQAFVAGEPDGAVPVDQVVVGAGGDAPALMLPPGDGRIVVQDESGNEVMRLPYRAAAPSGSGAGG